MSDRGSGPGSTRPSGRSLRVLLVEDNSSDQWLYQEILDSRGHDVVGCTSGEEAWKLLDGEAFPLILLDLGLEGQMDGLELCRRIRTRPGGDRPVVVVITGRTEPRTLEEVLRAGADDYVPKPVDVALLSVRLAVAERAVARQQERYQAYQDRDETSRQLATLLNDLGDVFFSARLDPPELLQLSPATRQVLGREAKDILADEGGAALIVPPEARVRIEARLADEDPGEIGRPLVHIYSVRLPDGRERWVQASYRISPAEGPVPARVDGTLTDVSDRQRIQQELAARTREMEALARLAEAALGQEDRDEAVLAGLEEVGRATGFPLVLLERGDPEAGTLEGDLLRGVDDPRSIRGREAHGEAPARAVLAGGAPRSFTDVHDFRHRLDPALQALEPRVFLAVPVRSGARTWGTLTLLHTEPAHPDGRLVRLATSLASSLALHLERLDAREERRGG